MVQEKIEAVEKIAQKAKSAETPGIDESATERMPPNREKFDTLVEQPEKTMRTEATELDAKRLVDTQKTSLMDEVRTLDLKVKEAHQITPDKLAIQAKDVIAQIDDIKGKLSVPNIELKDSVQNLLKNKLSHIDESLKIALNKAGIEYQAPVKTEIPKNPIERFLGFLTDGQHQLNTLANDVNLMHLNRKELSPASMLAVQIKVGMVQQELEFFAALLNKALESTKTIMNVQV